MHYQPFFYPLDAIYAWNRIYGSKGFFQYQCAVPTDQMEDAIREILERIDHCLVRNGLTRMQERGSQTGELLQAGCQLRRESLQGAQIYYLKIRFQSPSETSFWNTPYKRHLPTFKTRS